MHLLPCPHCDATHPVSPAQAGSQITCAACNQAVAVPRLGGLRQLPLAETDDQAKGPAQRDTPVAGRIAYSVLGLIGFVCLLVAAYGAVRWALMEVPATTDQHIAELRETYQAAEVGQLIREWEDIEQFDISATMPFPYRVIELRKQELGRSAATMATVGITFILAAIACLWWGRRSATPA